MSGTEAVVAEVRQPPRKSHAVLLGHIYFPVKLEVTSSQLLSIGVWGDDEEVQMTLDLQSSQQKVYPSKFHYHRLIWTL